MTTTATDWPEKKQRRQQQVCSMATITDGKGVDDKPEERRRPAT